MSIKNHQLFRAYKIDKNGDKDYLSIYNPNFVKDGSFSFCFTHRINSISYMSKNQWKKFTSFLRQHNCILEKI
jgi:hypothetical protein